MSYRCPGSRHAPHNFRVELTDQGRVKATIALMGSDRSSMDRRDFLRLGVGGSSSVASVQTAAPAPVPRVNGGINIPARSPSPRPVPGLTPPLILPRGAWTRRCGRSTASGFEHTSGSRSSFDRCDRISSPPRFLRPRGARAWAWTSWRSLANSAGYDLRQAIADQRTSGRGTRNAISTSSIPTCSLRLAQVPPRAVHSRF
jgi:hypothetical protein